MVTPEDLNLSRAPSPLMRGRTWASVQGWAKSSQITVGTFFMGPPKGSAPHLLKLSPESRAEEQMDWQRGWHLGLHKAQWGEGLAPMTNPGL